MGRSPHGGRPRVLCIGAIVLALVLHAQRANAWQAPISGTGSGPGEALAAAVAGNGDPIGGGYLDDATGRVFAVVRLGAADGAERWRRTLARGGSVSGTADRANAVVLDGAGDVLAAGTTSTPALFEQFTVVKLRGTTGVLAWRWDWPFSGQGLAVAVDDAGDVIAAGVAAVATPNAGGALTVVKLTGDTGAPAWTVQLEPGFLLGSVAAIALRPDGDVVASGYVANQLGYSTPVVVRLDRATGAEIWRDSAGLGCAARLAVSSIGDVFAADALCGSFQGQLSSGVVRLSGESGAEVWSRSTARVEVLTLDDDDNPIIVATDVRSPGRSLVDIGFRALRLAHADGAVLAERAFPGDPPCDYICYSRGRGQGAAVTTSGDVLLVGVLGSVDDRFVAARLAGSDLHEVWRRDDAFWHDVPGRFNARAAIAGPGDRLIVPGTVEAMPPAYLTFSVLGLNAVDGALDACGDARRDTAERCDDGLGASGCCAPDCAAAIADGTSCDDFDACTIGDQCANASCRGTAPLPCAPCGTCDARTGCRADILYECKEPTTTNAATLVVEQQRRGRRRLAWTMRSGAATAVAEFGNPLDGTEYALCAYAEGALLARAVARAGACARGHRCWHRRRRGFEYRNPDAPDGISRLSLRAGDAGRTRLRVAAHGAHLLAPALPLVKTGIMVQLRRSDDRAACWLAEHTVIVKNRSDLFRATGD